MPLEAIRRHALAVWRGRSAAPACRCRPSHAAETLRVDARDCPGGGRLAARPACRATVVRALQSGPVSSVVVETDGRERVYEGPDAALFGAAGRIAADAAGDRPRLARLARRDPLAVTGRAKRGSETALPATRSGTDAYRECLSPATGPTVSAWRVHHRLPPDAVLSDRTRLSTGATVRRYTTPEADVPRYHLVPAAARLDADALATLAAARDRLGGLATADAGGRAVRQAVRDVAGPDEPVAAIAAVLWKHTRGLGLLEDLFADRSVTDVFVTAPVADNAIRVRAGGQTLETNVRLTTDGVAALASRFRRESGRPFSRATPTLDAATEVAGRRIRVAGVTGPASDGHAFAFRAHDRRVWRLADLVGNDTLSPATAALLALAVRRGRSILITGSRGSGKTTLLGALLWELSPAVRAVVIEDAPELPVDSLQEDDRDVQRLRAATDGDDIDPATALRTALRLGDGALVVGEIRGAEAGVLYEAMRVGANSEAVLGTVHGEDARSTYGRVVGDLGVDPRAFCETDLIVTVESVRGGDGLTRRLRGIEEIVPSDPGSFEPLFERDDAGLGATGRITRGNSHLVAAMASPAETYRDVLDRFEAASARFARREAGDR